VRGFDVVVAGGGNAALCAAIEARRRGASVLLLERTAREWRGGNSKYTRNVRCAGDAYAEDEFLADLVEVTGSELDPELALLTIERSRELPGWLAAQGVRFLFEPRALSYHLHEISYRSLRNQAFDEGRSIIRLSEKFGIPVETLFGGSVGGGIDRVVAGGWTRVPGVMAVVGRALTAGVMAADAIRVIPVQVLTARIVHRFYKIGGLVAAGFQANGAR